jgi:L-alanine-DL-glutamate epimerase-like enolase superfamily enzyme
MEPHIHDVEADVFVLPTDMPGGDGTITWDSTTMVVVEVMDDAGGRGLGYTYGAAAAASVVEGLLRPVVVGRGVDEPRAAWSDMVALLRNAGRPGIGATAISAVDMALWDLKARRANQALFVHLGAARREVPVYGSGGLTTYSDEQLTTQLRGWVEGGIPRVKMKVGSDWGRSADEDVRRVAAAREAIGPEAELFVDANGAYTVKQAIAQARRFAEHGVTYFGRGGHHAGGRHQMPGSDGMADGGGPRLCRWTATLGALCAGDPHPTRLRRSGAGTHRVLP